MYQVGVTDTINKLHVLVSPPKRMGMITGPVVKKEQVEYRDSCTWYIFMDALTERLGSGLQNRVRGFNSHMRLKYSEL